MDVFVLDNSFALSRAEVTVIPGQSIKSTLHAVSSGRTADRVYHVTSLPHSTRLLFGSVGKRFDSSSTLVVGSPDGGMRREFPPAGYIPRPYIPGIAVHLGEHLLLTLPLYVKNQLQTASAPNPEFRVLDMQSWTFGPNLGPVVSYNSTASGWPDSHLEYISQLHFLSSPEDRPGEAYTLGPSSAGSFIATHLAADHSSLSTLGQSTVQIAPAEWIHAKSCVGSFRDSVYIAVVSTEMVVVVNWDTLGHTTRGVFLADEGSHILGCWVLGDKLIVTTDIGGSSSGRIHQLALLNPTLERSMDLRQTPYPTIVPAVKGGMAVMSLQCDGSVCKSMRSGYLLSGLELRIVDVSTQNLNFVDGLDAAYSLNRVVRRRVDGGESLSITPQEGAVVSVGSRPCATNNPTVCMRVNTLPTEVVVQESRLYSFLDIVGAVGGALGGIRAVFSLIKVLAERRYRKAHGLAEKKSQGVTLQKVRHSRRLKAIRVRASSRSEVPSSQARGKQLPPGTERDPNDRV